MTGSPGSPAPGLSMAQQLLADLVFVEFLSATGVATPQQTLAAVVLLGFLESPANPTAGVDVADLAVDQAVLSSGLAPAFGTSDPALQQQIAFLDFQLGGA
jgi:hypothetical protein